MKIGQIKKTKDEFFPLYKEGDSFKIVQLNTNVNLMPIEAMRIKDKRTYGFWEGELE